MNRRKALQKTGVLAGTAVLMPSLLSLLQSCKTESRLDWQPLFLTDDEAKTISTLIDMILPRTDTPGALDVKVDLFIDKVFAKTYDESGQQKIRTEIAAFNADCKNNFGEAFINLDEQDRMEVLKTAEASSGKFNDGVWGTTIGKQEPVGFYRSLKSMAIWAYFSSEEIGENILNYDPIPMGYQGCIPVSDVGNRWSL
ncbi:MAG: gluconate 2-dehydrogenase subunit 3 family protein [Maribacter sp.]|nr:gluconate 2-dehydrogenase subunit 3 family protein [Maribacter sp.]